jgi:hypothetical protein
VTGDTDPANLNDEAPGALQSRLQTLASKLGAIFYGPGDSKIPPRARLRYVQAFLEIIDFLNESRVHPLIMFELNEFVGGLIELNHGTVRHFLKPETPRSRPIDPDDIWRARAFLAMAVDELIKGGATRKSAARDIAKKTPPLSHVLSKSGGDYAGALDKWHASFIRGRVKSKGAQGVFNDRQRYVEVYREKLRQRVDPNLVENYIISSLLRDATVAAVRASNAEALDRVLERVKAARKKPVSKISGR